MDKIFDDRKYQQTLLYNMKAAHLQQSRAKSLKDQIYETIKNTKFQSVPNLLKKTRRRDYSSNAFSPQQSNYRPSVDSLRMQGNTSGPRNSLSPPCFTCSKASGHANRSIDFPHSRQEVFVRRNPTITVISTRSKEQIYHLSHPKRIPQYRSRSKRGSRNKRNYHQKQKMNKDVSKKSCQQNSRDKKDSRLNLSSILEQESSDSKMYTPSSKGQKQINQRRKLSGDRTKKKQRKGLRDVVWRRLQRCLRQPEKHHRLLKNDLLGIKFRVLRKTLLQIQIQTGRQLKGLNITLHKGNIECQGIHEYFPRLQANSIFTLYSSVRTVDLNDPMKLPKLLIEATVNEEQKFEKVVTLPYCWLHVIEPSNLRQISRSRIKTKACLEDMSCTKASLKGLVGVLPVWGSQSIGRGLWVWESRWALGDNEFQLRIVQQDGHFTAELCGRGEERLICMLQFIQELLQ